jgi:hypothetical protein
MSDSPGLLEHLASWQLVRSRHVDAEPPMQFAAAAS